MARRPDAGQDSYLTQQLWIELAAQCWVTLGEGRREEASGSESSANASLVLQSLQMWHYRAIARNTPRPLALKHSKKLVLRF